MFCRNCNREINDNAMFCSYCGAPQGGAPYYQAPPKPDPLYKICGFLLGLFTFPTGLVTAAIALVLYIIYRNDAPEKASALGKWTLWGVLASVLLVALLIILAVVLFTSIIGLAESVMTVPVLAILF